MVKDDSFVERALTRLIEAGLAEPTMIQGCSEGEIARLEKDLGVAFPAVYRQFLSRMGRSAGRFPCATIRLVARAAGRTSGGAFRSEAGAGNLIALIRRLSGVSVWL